MAAYSRSHSSKCSLTVFGDGFTTSPSLCCCLIASRASWASPVRWEFLVILIRLPCSLRPPIGKRCYKTWNLDAFLQPCRSACGNRRTVENLRGFCLELHKRVRATDTPSVMTVAHELLASCTRVPKEKRTLQVSFTTRSTCRPKNFHRRSDQCSRGSDVLKAQRSSVGSISFGSRELDPRAQSFRFCFP